MRKLLWLVPYAAALLLAPRAPCAGLAGIWAGQIAGRNGAVQDIAFKFEQKGDTLTGKMYLENDETPIAEGKIAGDQISFTVAGDLNGRSGKFRFTGSMKDGKLELTREREGGLPEGAGAGAGRGRGGVQKQTFTLSRLTS